MKMKNEDFIKKFLSEERRGFGYNYILNYQHNILYDYNHQFPIAIKLNDGYVVLNTHKYETTTSTHKYYKTTSIHQNILRNNIQEGKLIEVESNEIRDILDKMGIITDIKELMLYKLGENNA
jgi:uncharacterized protein with NRDE domain